MNFIIKVISNVIIYYLLLRYLNLKYRKRKNNLFCILFFFICILIVSCINLCDIPVLNLVSNLFFYNLFGYLFYDWHEIKEFLKDLIYFMILVLADSVCFFMTGLLYDNFGIQLVIFRTLASSILLILISFLANKIIMRTKINEIPYTEIIIFFMISLFNLLLILLVSAKYDYIINDSNKSFILLIVVGIVCVDLIIIHYLDYINKSYEMKKELISEQKHADLIIQHYKDLKKSNNETRHLIHDFKNHFQVVCAAYENGNEQLANKTISDFNFAYENVRNKYETGSDILNIILNEKFKMAVTNDIDFDFKQQQFDLSFISDFDMITIFGNLLDNALEANNQINISKNKFIHVSIYKVKEMAVINIANSCNNIISFNKKQIISSKNKNRGYGIQNIRKTIQKYDGDFLINISGNICDVIVSIPCLIKKADEISLIS